MLAADHGSPIYQRSSLRLKLYHEGWLSRRIIAQWSEWDLIENLLRAVIGSWGWVSVEVWELEGRSRAVIRVYLRAASSMFVKYEITLLRDAILVFGIAMSRQSWEAEGDGATFKARVQDDIRVEEIFLTHLNPKGDLNDRGWPDFEVALGEYGNKRVGIISMREPGPQGNEHCDEARWAERRLISGAMVPTETPPLAATATYTSTHIQLLSPTSSPFATVTPGRARVSAMATSELVGERRAHMVQSGENLWKLAQEHGVTVEAIMYVKDIDDRRIIEAGQEVIIPGPDEVFPTFTATPMVALTAQLSPTTTPAATIARALTSSATPRFAATLTSTPRGRTTHIAQPGETF